MSRYVLSATAKKDLAAILEHIAADNFDAADRVKDALRDAMRRLALIPGMGHRRADVAKPRYRFWVVFSYVIAYYPDTKPLQIVRVVNGARDFRKAFRR